ncbi:MAG TPA: hypothetical protein VIG33_01125 [Pseudobdellovibrionaceae bacterium]|jgi:hypothetical protein
MRLIFALTFGLSWSCASWAAVLHFYHNPRVPQALFHVALEYQGHLFEADPTFGGRSEPMAQVKKQGDLRIKIADGLINEDALEAELGRAFDFNFEWNNNKTYCAKLVGKALNMKPSPMNFAGTHYAIVHPEWLQRHDLGLSPDQIYEFALGHLPGLW